MSRDDVQKYFDILELSQDASLSDIKKAYLQLKELYSKDSIVMSPLIDEFSEETKINILDQIEDAYRRLLDYLEKEKDKKVVPVEKVSSEEEMVRKEIATLTEFSGKALRDIREKLRIGLYEITMATNIRMGYLEDIENEKFDALPPEVYLKGFLTDYARYLRLDHKKVVDDYVARLRKGKKEKGG